MFYSYLRFAISLMGKLLNFHRYLISRFYPTRKILKFHAHENNMVYSRPLSLCLHLGYFCSFFMRSLLWECCYLFCPLLLFFGMFLRLVKSVVVFVIAMIMFKSSYYGCTEYLYILFCQNNKKKSPNMNDQLLSCIQNPLHTFPGEVAMLLRTC